MSSSLPLTIYVAYHASGAHPSGTAGYLAVCNVRTDGSYPSGFDAYDDDGGVPEKNISYCELSPMRRLQERTSSEWVGLVHYRRIFTTSAERGKRGYYPGICSLPAFDWARPEIWGADAGSLLQAVSGLDWVTAPPFDVRRSGHGSLWEQFARNHPPEWLARIDRAVTAIVPRAPRFADYARAKKTLRPFNMFLGKLTLLRLYGQFLWPVLAEFERQTSTIEAGYQQRWAGFLAERLHGYWLDTLAPSGTVVGHLPVALLTGAEIKNSATGDISEAPQRSKFNVVRELAQATLSYAPPAAVRRVRRLIT
jgi:hypothetical protein